MKFVVTPKLQSLIDASSLSTAEKASLTDSPHISHANLVTFYRRCSPTPSLRELLALTTMYIPSYKEQPKPKSKEFVAEMEYLRLKAKEDEYQRLINPSTGPDLATFLYDNQNFEGPELTPAQMHKELKSQITTIFNIFISVASVVYAIWYWTGSSMRIKDSYRILLCIFFGLLILVAEVVVYMGYLNKIEEAKLKERKTREIKKVVRTIK